MPEDVPRDEFLDDLTRRSMGPLFEGLDSGPEWDDFAFDVPERRTLRPIALMAGAAGVAAVVVVAAVWIASGLGEDEAIEPIDTTTTSVDTTTTSPDLTSTTTPIDDTTTTIPTNPASGGSVVIAIDADLVSGFTDVNGEFVPASINPLLGGVGSGSRDLGRLVVPGAFRIDAVSGELLPWLVDEIPSVASGSVVVAEDGRTTITYRVRDEAVWEDGTPVTATDLAFTYDLVMRLGERSSTPTTTYELIDPSSLVVDGKTLTFTMSRPDPGFETLFEWVVPAHLIDSDSFANDWNDSLWTSAGPFRFVSLERRGIEEPSVVVLERNPAYWETDPATGDRLPYLDGIEVRAYAGGGFEPSAVTSGVTSGDIDAVLSGLVRANAGSDVERIVSSLESGGAEPLVEFDTLYEVLAFNLADVRLTEYPDSQNDVLAFREAVLAAIDRSRLGEELSRQPVSSIAGIVGPVFENNAWRRHDDPTVVPELLAGLPSPPKSTYVSSFADETVAIGEAVSAMLREAGIDTTTDFEGDFFGSQLADGLLDLYAFRVFPGNGGLASAALSLAIFDPTRDQGQFTVAWWGDAGEAASQFAAVMEEIESTVDHDRLQVLMAEAESILSDNAVVYPLVRRQPSIRAFKSNRILGIVPNRQPGWETWNAAWWWSPAG